MTGTITVTVETVQVRRSSIPLYSPPSLARGEIFVQLADFYWQVGDGMTPPFNLPRIPFLPASLLPLSNAALAANAAMVVRIAALEAVPVSQAQLAILLSSLPTSEPTTSGVAWNNGGVIQLS